MASLGQHNADCRRFLGQDCEPVNRWIDEFFPIDGPTHRKRRHHKEGVLEAKSLFGNIGEKAAIIHILRDCRHIPSERDYRLGYVDALGLKSEWLTAAYIQYSEEDFESLVQQFLKPSGVVLWAFIDSEAVGSFLVSVSKLSAEEISGLMPDWQHSRHIKEALLPLAIGAIQHQLIDISNSPKEVQNYLSHVKDAPFMQAISRIHGDPEFAKIPIDALVNPLCYIDYEYLESLKPELVGKDLLDILKFAIPEKVTTRVKVAHDPTGKNVFFISADKTITVSPVQITNSTEGTEVKFFVTSNLAAILVSNFSGRLILRNGIHRAFLLAQMGIREIPCILVHEEGTIPNVQTTAYPAFAPVVLMQMRPPMLIDFLNPELCIQVPLEHTNKIIRISADEVIVPTE